MSHEKERNLFQLYKTFARTRVLTSFAAIAAHLRYQIPDIRISLTRIKTHTKFSAELSWLPTFEIRILITGTGTVPYVQYPIEVRTELSP
jgi:hypothetical protein